MTEFSIVLPTTGDRAPVLDPVLRHVQLQSLTDWELLIIGDGVTDETRQTIERWCRDDPRMRFFGHPKHPRRGEIYRHEALGQARGRNVAYLCDRDLWLYDHLETLGRALEACDFAHTHAIAIDPRAKYAYKLQFELQQVVQRNLFRQRRLAVAMSSVGHTLASYRRLPFGWRTTPATAKTDQYMWAQFLVQEDLTATSVAWPTVLYFNRGDHPGWPSAARGEELQRWHELVADPDAQRRFRESAIGVLARPHHRLMQACQAWLFWHPGPQRIYWKVRGWLALKTMSKNLCRAFRNKLHEHRAVRHRKPRRSSLPSTSAVRRARVGVLEAETYRLRLRGADGIGASVYAGGEELLRFDCLGPGGHFHVNFSQSKFIADGNVPRIAFVACSVQEQAAEAVADLRNNLRNAIACNWHPAVRALGVSDDAIDELACFVALELSRLSPASDSVDKAAATCE